MHAQDQKGGFGREFGRLVGWMIKVQTPGNLEGYVRSPARGFGGESGDLT
jgi:hypothetical protein